ncbi:Crp/Fnr family transcriptional regulator [Confluentibacter citreus]|uniref:Crp/Fnr family transcriptional regulator n=1 Tax=Confluentibacter citreus TaxID=2007307 RepID=UPI0012FE6C51|nr:Crp/Fnr family transcriptional regulator [Confluentibacter citreus]
MNNIITFFNQFTYFSEEAFIELQNLSNFKKIGAGKQIIKFGEVPSKVYLLVSGVVRCYLSTESGKEFNKSFYLPLSVMGALTALKHKNESIFTFEALSDCEIYEVDYVKLMNLCDKNHSINKLYTRVLEEVYSKYETRLVELISLDARERYLELRKQIPGVDDLIPQYHIASYLGITAVQLSRIRKKMDSH